MTQGTRTGPDPSSDVPRLSDWSVCVSGAVTEHAQECVGLHALLVSHALHVEAQVCEELDHAHLLPRQVLSDPGTRGVAVGPRTAVNQAHGTTPGRSLSDAPVAVVTEAAVPALKRSGKRSTFHVDVHPVTEDTRVGVHNAVCKYDG